MSSPNKAFIRTYCTSFYGKFPDVNVYLLDDGTGDYAEPPPLRWYDSKKNRYEFGDSVIHLRDTMELGLWVYIHPIPGECDLLYSPLRKEYIYERTSTNIDKGMLKIFNRKEDQLSCDEILSLSIKIAEALDSDLSKELARDITNLARSLYKKADKKARDIISPILVLEDL